MDFFVITGFMGNLAILHKKIFLNLKKKLAYMADV
jgi:hypothetical protein